MFLDINNFGPFNSEVWGTFSDWLIFFATSITGLLIWLTLHSQRRIQDFEHLRIKREMLPKFIGKHRLDNFGFHIIELHSNNQPFYKFEYNLSQVHKSVTEKKFRTIDTQDIQFDFDSPIVFKFHWDEAIEERKFVFSLNVRYEDQMGNDYVMLFAVHTSSHPYKSGPREYDPAIHSKIGFMPKPKLSIWKSIVRYFE